MRALTVGDVIAHGTTALLGAREESPVLRRAIAALLWIMVAINAAYVGGLLLIGRDSEFVDLGLSLAGQWIPVTIFWLVAATTGFTRLPVILSAAGVTFSALGDTYYSLAVDADGYLEFPSPADPLYLLFYPLIAAALIVRSRSRLAGAGRLVVLEAVVATLGASAVLAILLGPLISDALSSGTLFESLVALAYPLFDLVLIAVIVGIVSMPTVRFGRRWWSLALGLGIFLAGDVVYALQEAEDGYVVGTPLDATWTIGLAFITWWVAGISRSEDLDVIPSRRGLGFSLPAVALLAGLAVLVVGTVVELSLLAIVLAAVTVGLGALPLMFRQAMLGRMLADQEQAVRALTELDQAKTDLLVTVNHEFRTPLTSLNGHVELLLDGTAGDLPRAATEMLRTIERNGAKLQELIDDTFSASRLEGGDGDLVRAPTDVADLVDRAVAKVEPFAHSHGVEVTVEGHDGAVVVDAESDRLERALVNLIDNAVKFTGPGGRVTIAIDGSPTANEVDIRITDTGIGVPSADIPRLFSRFFRASNAQKAAIPGVGLGLAITQQIVHAHGGTIAVDSAVGQGTTMTVRLPAAPVTSA
jgi:signal transduction histidine kinase